eukprot:scaffold53344_cov21-Tisochrysis_lutea.AAC.3
MAGGLLHDAWAHQIKKAFSLLRGHSLPDPCKPGPLRKRRQRGLFILSGGASASLRVPTTSMSRCLTTYTSSCNGSSPKLRPSGVPRT